MKNNGINLKENKLNYKFYKSNPILKKGISLIVLVITIIVIIILAAAVILTLNSNNPISEANKARYESDVANMQAIFTNTVAKVMAQKQSTIEVNAGELNSVKSGGNSTEGRVNYTVNNPLDSSDEIGTIIFNTGDNNATTFYTGRMLPLYKSGETTWYVDSEGVISLKVGEQEYGKGEKENNLAGVELKEEILITESDNPVLKSRTWSDTNEFYNDNYKKKITKIKFAILDRVPRNRLTEWDISKKRDKSIMAWIQDDGNEGYILTIAGKNKIIANSNSMYMFKDFSNLKEIENLEFLDTNNVTNMDGMFDGCVSLISLDLSKFNTEQVTSMSNMFTGCRKLTNVDISKFNTSKVTSMSMMFYNCGSLTSLDLSKFNTSSVSSMHSMFAYCSGLTSINISKFDTINVTSMDMMFYSCENLTSLNLSNFNTSSVINMSSMFSNCTNLTNLDLDNFNTSSVINMGSMFSNCTNLTNLDLDNFNTSSVTNMSFMFSNCTNLKTLNLNSFDTSKVYTMQKMLYNCPMLTTTIAVKNSGMTNYEWMLVDCATDSTAKITINYTSKTSSLVDSMIAKKSSASNVVKGVQI